MYGCESWTVKKAECRRIDAFEVCCWRRLLRVPWTARRSNQSVSKESTLNIHWKDWCRSWNFNTLITWCEEPTHWKRLWCWEGLGARGRGDDRGWDGWMASPTWWMWVWVNSRSWWWTGRPGVLRFMGLERVGHDWTTELNWTDLWFSCFQGINFPEYPACPPCWAEDKSSDRVVDTCSKQLCLVEVNIKWIRGGALNNIC